MTRLENKIRGAFEDVRAGERLKAATAQYLRQQRARGGQWETPRRSAGWVRGLAVACAAVVLVLAGGIWQGMVRTPVSYVSVDVDPSAELALNRFDRVVSAAAFSEDGMAVLDGLELSGRPYTEAVEALLSSDAMASSLTSDVQPVLTVAAADGDRQARLLEGVGTCVGQLGYDGVCYGADVADVAAAHSCGMSLGKYAAWQTLGQYGQTLTEEECQGMTMGELYDRIHECEDGGHHEDEHSFVSDVNPTDAVQSTAPAQSAVPPTQSVTVSGHHSHGHHAEEHE